MKNTCEVICGDCIEKVKELIEKGVKVDLTVTSPPYDDLRTYLEGPKFGEETWRNFIPLLYEVTNSLVVEHRELQQCN